MMIAIDINCDMGESLEAVQDGSQEALMPYVTSVNVACGGHAGDERTMRATMEQAARYKLALGAHPGYPDRAGFGRHNLNLPLDAVERTVCDQLYALAAITKAIVHVKPHGALYNQAVKDRALATAIARGAARFSRNLVLVGLAGSEMLIAFHEAGFRTMAEGFADRRYEPDGTLRSREFGDALISDPATAAAQALRLAQSGTVQTICIHSDSPNALAIAKAVCEILRTA